MVARPERDADEGQVALDRDGGDRAERAVAAGDAERVRAGGARDLRRILVLAQHVRRDAEPLGLGTELLGGRAVVAGARVDEEEARHVRATY